ncbi:hypothetical protein [Cryobacterium sp. MDB2-33-2]|uniref:hypothetical protein n=1 Tax=Cryobacterium sp. MDB2-33-2 TaxID=1259179 RepID=UPI00106CD099|nr:hypothetical protein [Cryobacterium sp. MDB2-33-2]TFC05058.1 hypothetical protein E3O59_13040 [Cryobacterium sp. MDB2-33-2]
MIAGHNGEPATDAAGLDALKQSDDGALVAKSSEGKEHPSNKASGDPTSRTSVEKDSKGEAALRLLMDPKWILRRVESVVLKADGQTNRRISFDFKLPQNARIPFDESPDGKPTMVAVPLTFMSKGTIVNLNVSDSTGSTLPVLGFSDNGKLTLDALVLLAILHGDIVDSQITCEADRACGCTLSEQPDSGPVGLTHVRKAISNIVYSTGRTFRTGAEANANRTKAFLLLQQGDFAGATVVAALDDDHDVKGLFGRLLKLKAMETEVLANEDEVKSTKRHLLSGLIALLSTVSHSYWFAVVMPVEHVQTRTIVKVSYDADNSRFESLSRREDTIVWAKRQVWPVVQTPLHFATWSAASTHLEVETTRGLEITRVVQSVGSKDADTSGLAIDCKQANSRTHLTVQNSRQPLTELVFTISPRRFEGMIFQAFLWSIACLAFVVMASVLGFNNLRSLDLFQAGNVIALATLIVGLGSAVLIIDSRHQFERVLLGPPRSSLILALTLMVGTLVGGMVVTTGVLDVGIVHLLKVSAIVCASLNAGWACSMLAFANSSKAFRKDHWRVTSRVMTGSVFVQNPLAVTETAAFSAFGSTIQPNPLSAEFIQQFVNQEPFGTAPSDLPNDWIHHD